MSLASDVGTLLDLCKSVATIAGERLLSALQRDVKQYSHSPARPREIKAVADDVMETIILGELTHVGLPILSEESGYVAGRRAAKQWLIVDPLDGTFNFVRNLGPSAVSIALWEEATPVFGVIYDLGKQELSWGGAALGAFCGGAPIRVSTTTRVAEAAICTGFPARFDLTSDAGIRDLWHLIRPYAKVRMLGSAATSLLHVAKGAADAYAEHDVMLWDVAAGLPIVEGAGGTHEINETATRWCYHVQASNGRLDVRETTDRSR